jgi:hypothetical protein
MDRKKEDIYNGSNMFKNQDLKAYQVEQIYYIAKNSFRY